MSTTSCPRCAGQVTLPAGVSDSAQVRCPLCNAQYSLADALSSRPPVLEVVDPSDPDSWFDDMPADDATRTAGAADLTATEPLDLEQPVEELGDDLPAVEGTADEPLEFAAEEADEELLDRQNDAGDDEISFSTTDSATPDAGEDDNEVTLELGADDAAAAASEEETLGFNPVEGEDTPAEVEFDVDPTSETADGEAATLEFGDPQAAGEADNVQFDFDEPQAAEADDVAAAEADGGGDGIQFDLDASEQPEPAEQAGLGEFGDVQFDASGESEEIPLDAPDEAEAAQLESDEEEEPADKKKGKKKKAKAANGKASGSIVGTLVKVFVPLIIVVPLALYGALWLGYDPVGLSALLPGFMVPEDTSVAQGGSWTPEPGTIFPTPNPADSTGDASGEHTTARPELPGDEPAPDSEMPADEPPALAPDSTVPDAASENEPPQPDAAATDAPPAAETAEPGADTAPAAADPFAPAEATPEMPNEGDAAPAPDDPFAQPETPQTPPAETEPAANPFAPGPAAQEMPDEGAAEAADDPFSRPADSPAPAVEPEPMPESSPAADDPFGTPPTDAKPVPADEPFGTPTTEAKLAPADDPFAPATETDPAAEKPTELPQPGGVEPLPSPDQPAEPAATLGPRSFAQVTPAEVLGAMQATMAASQKMTAAEGGGDPAQLNKARANFYVSLFDMANAITLGKLGPAAAQLDTQLRVLEPMVREQLATDPRRFEHLKVFGARWFAFPKRTTDGVVLAGTVQGVDQVGKLFHTKVQSGADAGAAPVTVVSANDPQLEAGNEVMTFGSIVEQPADQLAGYEGSEPAVVWSGMTLKVAPAAN